MRTVNSPIPDESEIVAPDNCPCSQTLTADLEDCKAASKQRTEMGLRSRDRRHLIYPEIEPEAAQQARALLSLAVAADQNAAGAWVSARDLARLYREHRKAQGLPRLCWTAIARHLKHFAPKKLAKRNGRRRVWYRVPRQLEKAEMTP